MQTRRLIINADDLGFSRGVTDGILHCHRAGILTSTTLMTTMPDRDRAIELAKSTPALGVGIHLCLTQGTPLTKCTRLLDADGTFPRSLPKLALRLMGRPARQQAVDEWAAQVDHAVTRGLVPTHLDSHKHIHHLPALHDAVMAVAERFAIPHVRCAREYIPPGGARPGLGYRVLDRCARALAPKLTAHGVATTDWFFGLATTGRTTAGVWQNLLAHLPGGTGEVMVHPGYIADITAADTRLLQERLDEQAALLDPAVRDAVAAAGAELCHYGQLAGAGKA